MPDVSDGEDAAAILAEAIGNFYFLEHLNSICLLIPLFQVREDDTEPFYTIFVDFLPQIILLQHSLNYLLMNT
jgi:hypothetical protein